MWWSLPLLLSVTLYQLIPENSPGVLAFRILQSFSGTPISSLLFSQLTAYLDSMSMDPTIVDPGDNAIILQ